MGKLKGQIEYLKFKEGKSLSPKQAIKAHCFVCNGEKEGSSEDCKGLSCPLYPLFKRWVYSGRTLKLQAEKHSLPLDRTV